MGKRAEELKPGDVFVIDLPCQVRVVSVENAPEGGSAFIGNLSVFYVGAQPVRTEGRTRIGSKVEVDA